MSDSTSAAAHVAPAGSRAAGTSQELDEAECLRLITPGGVGRIAFTGRYGPTVFPVNYKLHQGDIIFRTERNSATDEDLRTGIQDAGYRVAFEIDNFNHAQREGWSVLVHGAAYHMESDDERAAARESGVESWAGGDRDMFVRIVPSRLTGRRITHR